MVDHKALYHIMFNAATTAIDLINAGAIPRAKAILIEAQQKCEDIYIHSDESE